MLSRVLEPEVMDTVAEAEDYNAMDHSHVNRVFVDDLLTALQGISPSADGVWRMFDAGTGTALIPLELLSRGIRARITAADLAEEMLAVARRNLAAAGINTGIDLVKCDCKRLSAADGSFDVVMSNSIVHHIPEPRTVLSECWRVTRPGGLLFVRDLMRPREIGELEHLVATYAGTANAHGRQMFRDSLHAALTLAEVCELAASLGINPDGVQATSDRHWTLSVRKPL